MLYTITVLDFTIGKVTVYTNVDLIGKDAEDYLTDILEVDLDNCQWMCTPAHEWELESIDRSGLGAFETRRQSENYNRADREGDNQIYDNDSI